ncbi:hypothetical protein ACLOJK_017232 [Asimina triloba]
MASPTPCCLAGSERAEDVVADALQPCRKRKGKGMGGGGSDAGATLPETKGKGGWGQRRWAIGEAGDERGMGRNEGVSV